MQNYRETILSKVSAVLQPIQSVTVSVTASNGKPAALYSDNGVTPITGNLITDANGYFSFYAANGTYTVSAQGTQIGSASWSITLYDPADAPPLTLAQAAGSNGSSLIGNGTETVANSFNALQLADYTALRAYSGPRQSVYVTGYLATATPSGIAGMFVRDDSDTAVLGTPVNSAFAVAAGSLAAATYYYRVSAIDAYGETLASTETSFAVPAPLAAPANVAFSTAAGSLAAGTYYYRVSAINGAGETLASTETSLAIPAQLATPVTSAFSTATTGGTLAAGTYYYRVSAINAVGETLASTETSITTTGTTSTVTANWGAVTGATGYKIYGRSAGAELLVATVGNVTTWTDTGAVTPAGALPTSNTTSGGVTVAWGAVTGATGYKVYGRTTGAEQLMATVGAVTSWTDNGSITPSGALPASNTTSGGVTVNWGAVANATGYKIYGRSTGAELFMAKVGNVTSWTDNGSITPAGALPTGYKKDNGGFIIQDATGRRWKRQFNGDVSAAWFGIVGDATTDCTAGLQAAINACMFQYDPGEKTHDGNNWTYKGKQRRLMLPDGIYVVSATLNMKFRNEVELYGESMYGAVIRWNGTDNGMMIDARCSNYLTIRDITLDGNFKAKTHIYCAGNGNNASGAKGNVTANRFARIYFWNQKGYLTGTPIPDYPDQYDPLSAMLCISSIEAPSWYNSMDDSIIEECRFAPNSLNNNFGIAISSSAIVVRDCWFFTANGLLLSNGAAPWLQNCTFSTYAPKQMDATHNHAVVKFVDSGIGYAQVTLSDCYHESMDYYGNGFTSVLAYQVAGTNVAPESQAHIQQLLIRGGLYSCNKDAVNYIDLGAYRRANIVIDNAAFQGANKGRISAPNGSIAVTQTTGASSAGDNNSCAWQPVSYQSLRMEYSTPDYRIHGERTADVTVTVGTTDDPAALKFTSIDAALPYISTSKGQVTLYMQKSDTITQPITLDTNLYIAVQGYTLTFSAVVKNFGQLVISNSFANSTRGGSVVGSARELTNYGALTVKNVAINALVSGNGGRALFDNVDFQGTADVVTLGDAAEAIINNDNCTYSATGFVANLGSKFSKALVKSSFGANPSTGKWMRGTIVEYTNPSTGFANLYYATADGIGSAATWAKVGTLS